MNEPWRTHLRPAIADPGTTAVWEQALDMIGVVQMTLDTFIDKQSAWVAQLVQPYRNVTLSIKLPPTPVCPQYGSPMATLSPPKVSRAFGFLFHLLHSY